MFLPLKTETESRFAAVESFFRATRILPKNEERAARGLAFVHMYAAYEHTIRTGMQLAIDTIASKNHQTKELSPPLLSLFLDSKLRSLKDCGTKDIWKKRLQLFEEVFSNSTPTIDNQIIPTDGTHYRYSHLQTIFAVLGINRMPARRTIHLHRINEIVGNRNAIAHGRETADEVGRRYSRSDVQHRIKQIKSVSSFFITAIESHCGNPINYKRSSS
ncbi:MAG: hypothetical protein J0I10_08675 [Verrucomicrobia bacterium]|nr:hypothetical protein [Verrucomicrobiota bacterium]